MKEEEWKEGDVLVCVSYTGYSFTRSKLYTIVSNSNKLSICADTGDYWHIEKRYIQEGFKLKS